MAATVLFVIVCAVKAALILGAAAATCRLLRRQSAAIRHAVWTAGICASLLLPAVALASTRFAFQVRELPAHPLVRSLLAPEVLRSAVSIPRESIDATAEGDHQPDVRRSSSRVSAGAVLFVIWLTGTVVIGMRIAFDLRRAHRLIARARPIDNPRIVDVLTRLGGLAQRARVLQSDDVAAPVAAGLFRGAIVLPDSLTSADTMRLSAVIAHEAGHLARHDSLVQVVGRLACAVYWFNPLQWFAARALQSEAERACDDRALESGVPALGYAEVLLAVAEDRANLPAGVVLPMASGARDLERRLTAILDPGTRRHRCSAGRTLIVATSAFVMGSALAGFQLRAAPLEPVQRHVVPPGAGPQSERVPVGRGSVTRARAAVSPLNGPDAALARTLKSALDHVPLHPADLIAERAAWALSKARDGLLIDPLLEALDAGDWRDAAYAAWALSLDERPNLVVPALVTAMQHQAWRVRANAAAGLARLTDRRAIPAMREALADAAWQVRLEAVSYFARLGDIESLEAIKPALSDGHVAVRLEAEAALQASGRR